MIVSIKSENFNLTLPVLLSMGSVIIRCIPKEQLNNQQKNIALQLFKAVKGSLKGYKGLKVVEVVSQNGEHITVTI
ncbi:hypothetical protein KQI18_11230 [Clostridioides mangenotii]|uniref:hypothetical protein n=1 Tax=Metaclostridioides mangenotii TaxID=1540 RepID=UPI001C10D047|nr:hypothetical protein [Clostridioides mangenotii]MBU5308350.1 hypothetical protein [Clostridioides mangenotii]